MLLTVVWVRGARAFVNICTTVYTCPTGYTYTTIGGITAAGISSITPAGFRTLDSPRVICACCKKCLKKRINTRPCLNVEMNRVLYINEHFQNCCFGQAFKFNIAYIY